MKVSLLTPNLHIIPDINDSDFDFIQKVIASTYLSYYEIQKTQFIVLKDNEEIIAFGRIFPIGENEEELGTLWVKESMRGQKLGITLMKELIKKKKTKIFLLTSNDFVKESKL